MTTLQRLGELARRELDLDPQTLDPDAPLATLGVDSLSLADFIFKVEDEFDIRIELPDLDPALTLAAFASRVDAEVAKKGEARPALGT